MKNYESNHVIYIFMLKNCIGAIDGTHVDARILQDQQIAFRGGKTNTI